MTSHDRRPITRRTLLTRSAAALPAVAAAGRTTAPVGGAAPAVRFLAQTPAVQELVAGNTAFAFDLYAALRQDEALVPTGANLLVSPYSISQALARTYAGAGGETAVQMAETLAFALPQHELNEAFAALNADLIARGNAEAGAEPTQEARSLRIANALWVEQTYPLIPSYTAEIERLYGVGLNQADFRNAPEETREEINAWVEEQTEDRIQDIVQPGDITDETVFALANAIYFYGAWKHAFAPEDTHDDAFHRLDGTTVAVPLMYQVAELPYAWGDGYQVIELPYAGSGLALTVILPDEGQFETVEAELDAQTLDAAIGRLAASEVHVYLPKFELEFGPIELKDALQALGMVDAFSERADFSGIAPGGLIINKVLHKTFVSVDEQGTEAAAATVIIASPGAGVPLEVRIERPFLFALRDTQTGALLFLGRVMDPKA